MKEDKPGWHKSEPVDRVYVKYYPKNNLPTNKTTVPSQREKDVKEMESAICITNEANQKLNPSQQ